MSGAITARVWRIGFPFPQGCGFSSSRAPLHSWHACMVQECEDALRVVNTLPRLLLPLERAALQLRRAVSQELDEAGVHGVASTWGGLAQAPPASPVGPGSPSPLDACWMLSRGVHIAALLPCPCIGTSA